MLHSLLKWSFVVACMAGIAYSGYHFGAHYWLTHSQVLLLAFCLAFVWVNIFKLHVDKKPFSCITCMSGWFSLAIGVSCIGWYAVLYMPVAMTIAALYSEVRDRWL